ncbi:hypothetical protein Nepgr_024392 [Nepenthes gracilis]|uniref:ATP-dependent RNA helicase n=1 Tax=Nepenthes gracilis TaxID=150966 RepID=A0AAD3T540_NEPGR|nr:hypothetical protein Nepgr_024392 [Nepenthes gracilis]
MPVNPLPPSLFRSSIPAARFSHMTFTSTGQRSRAPPIFARVFPFKFKHLGHTFPPSRLNPRAFSTGPFRSKPDSGSKYHRGVGELRTSKSLIEDEAELSDWVDELRTGSYDAEEAEWGKGKRRGTERDDSRDLGSFRKDGRVMKRGRERGFDNLGRMDKGVFKDAGYSGSKNTRFRERVDKSGLEGDENERWNSMKKKGGVRDLGTLGKDGRTMKRGRESGFDSMGRMGKEGFRNSGYSGLKNSRFRGKFDDESEDDDDGNNIDDDDEGEDDDEGWNLNSEKVRVQGGRMGGERVSKNQRDQIGAHIGRGKKGSGRQVKFSSEDESGEYEGKDRSLSSIMDLISEEDSAEDSDIVDDDNEGEMKSRSSLFGSEVRKDRTALSSPGGSDSYLSETRFDQCAISPLSLKGIKDAGYEKMTEVQAATLPVILKGKDVLAKAKTGTGKTVAFLLPSIEVVVNSPLVSRDQKRPPILVLVICPTRELATQATAEANTLLKYHPSIGVQVVIGGTRLAVEQKRMQANPCQILVATPGRLRDHLENTAGFATRLMGVKVLVLDEADHLLDMGFRKDIERIIAAVPKQRQTLLFSATVPEEVRQICYIALKRDHEFISTVQEGSEETHSQVRQMHLVAPLDNHFLLLYIILKEHVSDDVNYKVLVFCTTAMVTKLVADLLGELNLNIREIHSRKPQSYRTRVSDEFRKSKGLILVTSDVSARGVDYPDVTLVIQMGLPSDREQYIHRLGRTGRKGKEGQGILLLAPWEEFFLHTIKDLPITKAPMPMVDPDVRKKVERALSQVEMKNKESAYQAWLGYYNSNKIVGRDKYKLVELANEFSRSMGLDNPPAIPKLIIGKMGLRNIPGLRSK